MRLSIIVAMDRNRVIGRGGTLPWRLSADLKRFKALTMGHHLIMGRKTFESIGRALPGRTSIVITHNEGLVLKDKLALGQMAGEGIIIQSSLVRAIKLAASDSEVFVIGGAQIYALALPRADRLYVTHVEAEVEGDTFFPSHDWNEWRQVEETDHAADTKNEFPHHFCIYDRITASPKK
ncbi:MAG: dihydrofolate reductase [Pirellulaceae bacterium]